MGAKEHIFLLEFLQKDSHIVQWTKEEAILWITISLHIIRDIDFEDDDIDDDAQVKSLHKGEMGEGGLLGRVSASTNMFLVDGLAR